MELFIKRIFDFILSAMGLAFSLPLWGIVSFSIYIEDGRPILFLQERVGKGGKRFIVIKFRTMQNGQLHIDVDLLEDDPRVTKVGRMLRALAIDELPQLINILKGDMSFVGPKPLPYVIEDEEQSRYKYIDEVPGYETRIKLRPGLTGMAQIYAPKCTSREDKFRYDNLYMKKQSLLLDLKLILLSFLITFRAKWESEEREGSKFAIDY